MAAALLQTQFLVYFVISCVALGVLISLSDTIGSEYIFIDLSVVAIFGKEKEKRRKKKKPVSGLEKIGEAEGYKKGKKKWRRTLTLCSQLFFVCLHLQYVIGGYTVLATKGVSSLLSLSFYKMFTYPISYLLVFVLVSTAVLQIKFLNKSLQRFDSTVSAISSRILTSTPLSLGFS